MDTQESDLIFFDINGFHQKNPIVSERRVILVEFHDGKSNIKIGKVILDNSKFQKNTIKNLDFLFSNNNINFKDYRGIVYSDNLPLNTPFKVFYYYFKSFLKLIYIKIKSKIQKNR